MTERPLNKHCLDTSDVFILDMGLTLYQWNGTTCNKDERFKAAEYLQGIKVSKFRFLLCRSKCLLFCSQTERDGKAKLEVLGMSHVCMS